MDPILLMAHLLLLALGANAVAANSPELLTKYLAFAALSLAVAWLFWYLGSGRARVSPLRPELLIRLGLVLHLAALALMAAAALIGPEIHGSQRWLAIPGFIFIPSEFAKLTMTLCLLRSLLRYRPEAPAAGMQFCVVVTAGIAAWQRDLSGAIIFLLLGAVVMFLGRIPLRRYIAVNAATALVGLVAVIRFFPDLWTKASTRFKEVQNPENYSQTYFAKQALANPTLIGHGPGAKFVLPNGYNDLAVVTIWYTMGILGFLLLLMLYAAIFIRAREIMAKRPEHALLTSALLAVLGVQVILHLLTGLIGLPNGGISLPLASYGGSSMLATGALMGMLHALSPYPERAGRRGEAT